MGGLTPFCKPSLPSLHVPEALQHCPPLRMSAQEPVDPLCWSLQPHSSGWRGGLPSYQPHAPHVSPTPRDLMLCGTPSWHLPCTVPPDSACPLTPASLSPPDTKSGSTVAGMCSDVLIPIKEISVLPYATDAPVIACPLDHIAQ